MHLTYSDVETGEKIRRAFEWAGFEVEWDGKIESRPQISGLKEKRGL